MHFPWRTICRPHPRPRSAAALALVALTACAAHPTAAAPAASETMTARRISLRDAEGRERILLDADEGILLRNARGNAVCKLQVLHDDNDDAVSLQLGSDRSLQPLEGGAMWLPELVVGVVDGGAMVRLRRKDGTWLLLRPGTGLELFDK
jgi:hypothetical protein